MSRYTLISSDSHIIDPPDLWEQGIDCSTAELCQHTTAVGN